MPAGTPKRRLSECTLGNRLFLGCQILFRSKRQGLGSSSLLGSCPCLFEQIGQNLASIPFKNYSKNFQCKKRASYHYRNSSVQKTRLSGRDRNFRSVGGGGIPPPPTDHFSATSLKILFARIDRGSDRVVVVHLLLKL